MSSESRSVKAYILAIVELGAEHDIAKEIRKIDKDAEIETDLVFGEYDMVITVKTDSIRKLDRIVTEIRKMKGVLKTVTLIAS